MDEPTEQPRADDGTFASPTAAEPGAASPEQLSLADEGFESESHSEPAGPPAPDDTTAQPLSEQEAADPPVEVAAAEPIKTRAEKRSEKKGERYKDIDRQRRDLERDNTRLQDELARARAASAAPAAPVAAPVAVAEPARPARPKLDDFETEEAFHAAVDEWHRNELKADRAAHNAEITKQVTESRERERQEESLQAQVAERNHAIEEAREAHPDWDEKSENLKDMRSSWYDPKKHGKATTPFLSDLASNTAGQTGDVLYWLSDHPEQTQVLADLQPTRPLRDAVVMSSAPLVLLEYFATDDGRNAFESLRRLRNPIDTIRQVGFLEASLVAASNVRGPAPDHPVSHAAPPVQPPVGTPGARAQAPDPSALDFETRMARDDKAEDDAKYRLAGGVPA